MVLDPPILSILPAIHHLSYHSTPFSSHLHTLCNSWYHTTDHYRVFRPLSLTAAVSDAIKNYREGKDLLD